MRRFLYVIGVLLLGLLVIGAPVARADTTDSTVYGSGNYGDCNYGSCTITLSSGGSTTLNVVPTPAGKCSVQSDTASVLTDSTSGYNLTMTTSTTNNAMTSGSGSIAAASGTAGSPSVLAMNTWGYRVDGLAGFGAGPASTQSSGSVPSVSFAGVPASNQTGTAVASSNAPANPAAATTVWYGLCADASQPAGSYSVTVTYTAVTN
jgi:hypothetical protein